MTTGSMVPLAAVPDFDIEMETTRRVLERVPMDRAAWKPHPKSTSLGALAAHVAGLVSYGSTIAADDEMDLTLAGTKRPPALFPSTRALLEAFDASVAASRAAIAGVHPEALLRPWTLRAGDHVLFSLPRGMALRLFLLNHLVHHRGQLSVYLRELEVPLPSIYGPTADD